MVGGFFQIPKRIAVQTHGNRKEKNTGKNEMIRWYNVPWFFVCQGFDCLQPKCQLFTNWCGFPHTFSKPSSTTFRSDWAWKINDMLLLHIPPCFNVLVVIRLYIQFYAGCVLVPTVTLPWLLHPRYTNTGPPGSRTRWNARGSEGLFLAFKRWAYKIIEKMIG